MLIFDVLTVGWVKLCYVAASAGLAIVGLVIFGLTVNGSLMSSCLKCFLVV